MHGKSDRLQTIVNVHDSNSILKNLVPFAAVYKSHELREEIWKIYQDNNKEKMNGETEVTIQFQFMIM